MTKRGQGRHALFNENRTLAERLRIPRAYETAEISARPQWRSLRRRLSLAPDTVMGLVQHVGICPRWLDQIVTGGASSVTAPRRTARTGDTDLMVCAAGDTGSFAGL